MSPSLAAARPPSGTPSGPPPWGGLAWAAFLASIRAWLFLAVLLAFFEAAARLAYGTSFLFSALNLRSIAVFAVAPALLGLGQTLVIIAGGIDLSVGFTMGFASVAAALFRMILTPVDTVKTTMQTDGKAGLSILRSRVRLRPTPVQFDSIRRADSLRTRTFVD